MKSPFSTPNTQRKKQQFLISQLLEDFKEENYTHLFTSNINLDNFEVVKVIGRGSYAKVYLVKKFFENSTEVKFYALKVLKKKALYDKNQLHHTL
jgi:serine/threonine protein kinase